MGSIVKQVDEVVASVKKGASRQRQARGKQTASQAKNKKKAKVRVKHSFPWAVCILYKWGKQYASAVPESCEIQGITTVMTGI